MSVSAPRASGAAVETSAPVLRIRLGPGLPLPPKDEDRAATLLMATLTGAQLEVLSVTLRDFADRLAIRRNPFAEDLSDDPPEMAVRQWWRERMPQLTAARTIAEPYWVAGDRTLAVSVAPRCDANHSEAVFTADVPGDSTSTRCAPVWGAGDTTEERARFAAWPVTRALVLRAPSDEDARRGAERLRSEVVPGSRIALVLLDEDARREDRAEERAVRTAAGAAASLLDAEAARDAAPLQALSHERPAGRLFADLGLLRRDVLVVPKLSSLAERIQFVAEVEGRRAALAPVGSWTMPSRR